MAHNCANYTAATLVALTLTLIFALIVQPNKCESYDMCINAANGTVYYNNVPTHCVAKPSVQYRCAWQMDNSCPIEAWCSTSVHNYCTIVAWTSFCLFMLLCIAIFLFHAFESLQKPVQKQQPNSPGFITRPTSTDTDLTAIVVSQPSAPDCHVSDDDDDD